MISITSSCLWTSGKTLSLVLAVGLMVGCSDSSGNSTSDNATGNVEDSSQQQVSVVPAGESPLSSTSGTLLDITPEATVFALSESKVPETRKIDIRVPTTKSPADLSSLLGKRFIEYEIPEVVSGVRSLIRTNRRIKYVSECDGATKICQRIPFSIKASGDAVFVVRNNRFYAIVTEGIK